MKCSTSLVILYSSSLMGTAFAAPARGLSSSLTEPSYSQPHTTSHAHHSQAKHERAEAAELRHGPLSAHAIDTTSRLHGFHESPSKHERGEGLKAEELRHGPLNVHSIIDTTSRPPRSPSKHERNEPEEWGIVPGLDRVPVGAKTTIGSSSSSSVKHTPSSTEPPHPFQTTAFFGICTYASCHYPADTRYRHPHEFDHPNKEDLEQAAKNATASEA